MKLSVTLLVVSTRAWKENEYPNHILLCDGPTNKPTDGSVLCKKIQCKYFPKLKITKQYMNDVPSAYIDCPNFADAGCETKWGLYYRQGKSKKIFQQSTHAKVAPNGMKHSSKTGNLSITCLNTGVMSKSFCKPKYNKKEFPYTVEFDWNKPMPECAEAGESWAPWSNWSGVNGKTCERTTATRTRQCLDGPHPGAPTPCKSELEGESEQVKNYWPEVCQKCHADLGMAFTPGETNIPKLNVPNMLNEDDETRYDDGFIPVGEGVVKVRCYDQEAFPKPYKQTCKCDKDGCRIGDVLCEGDQYNGYGHKYYWQPGAKDTFKKGNTVYESVIVKPDYSITYTNQTHDADERVKNRITWWGGSDGPAVCRYWNKKVYLPGVERPTHRNEDGGLDEYYFNGMECDNYVKDFPEVSGQYGTASNGARSYEVLTSVNDFEWVGADTLTDDEIENKMLITGTTNKEKDRKFHGLCRFSKDNCTINTGLKGSCISKVVNQQSNEMMTNAKYWPGLLHWSNGKLKCLNLFVTAAIKETEARNKFDILVTA